MAVRIGAVEQQHDVGDLLMWLAWPRRCLAATFGVSLQTVWTTPSNWSRTMVCLLIMIGVRADGASRSEVATAANFCPRVPSRCSRIAHTRVGNRRSKTRPDDNAADG